MKYKLRWFDMNAYMQESGEQIWNNLIFFATLNTFGIF